MDAGLTARALAKLAGWHFTKVSKLEHGTRRPSLDDIRAWCRSCQAEDQVLDLMATMRGIDEGSRRGVLTLTSAHVTGRTGAEETRSLTDAHAARERVAGFSGWDIGAAALPAVRPGTGRARRRLPALPHVER